ncbi:type-F conjugative transfer system protein TraW [Novosphingobium sp. P6W]|uniref:type-F conjugative transfer system protein TraW n=1 Tax=Novosphingobium sp. P6W TaxID=1609758 RepID=UPI0005C31AAC|nr:type-F conjugative transfer system protein TraW [Novosphingobium sp. P6W]AXB80449.1 type-F conjugative transfer system protein TraW [Novosphingobium sp. P6W]KIS31289.1 conjugal transfer protein TraW [Novosphingobium sp. P6W]
MRILPFALAALVGAVSGTVLPWQTPAHAVDHGQVGEAWPVVESDLLDVIRAKLESAKASGKLDELNARFAQKVKARVMRPAPVGGISAAIEDRSWEFDPTVVIESDIRDHKGKLIAAAGQRINPLDKISMTQKLLFIDGDDPAQVSWAMAQGDDLRTKVIMVKGSPFDLMKANQRRFYFDQAGSLTAKFGIEHTPASVEQKGRILIVTEDALRQGKGA